MFDRKDFQLMGGLSLFWIILAGEITFRQGISAIIAGIFVTWLNKHLLKALSIKRPVLPPVKILMEFAMISVFEIFTSTIRHIGRILRPDSQTTTYQITLSVKNQVEAMLICNLIALSPGTTVLEYDGKNILVLSYENEPKIKIETLEKPFMR